MLGSRVGPPKLRGQRGRPSGRQQVAEAGDAVAAEVELAAEAGDPGEQPPLDQRQAEEGDGSRLVAQELDREADESVADDVGSEELAVAEGDVAPTPEEGEEQQVGDQLVELDRM